MARISSARHITLRGLFAVALFFAAALASSCYQTTYDFPPGTTPGGAGAGGTAAAQPGAAPAGVISGVVAVPLTGAALSQASNAEEPTKPVKGAKVTIPGTNVSAVTGEDGSFTIRGVPEGKYEVNIEKDDDGDGASELKIHQKDVEVTKDNGRHLGQVKLKRAGSVSGKALIDKNLVGNIGVTVFVPGTSFLAITDDSGAYTISFLAEGVYTVAAQKAGFTTAMVEKVTVEAGKDTPGVDLALTRETGTPRGGVSGTVKRADAPDHSKIQVKVAGTGLRGVKRPIRSPAA
ncbi:MAG: carboxypeptidase regulatory-like domain-containing protein [Planctomycetes bacterium]|nr:carboxypeptidase regulatory-like domain-containing protein [Planctomycetota bacterium]